MADEENQEQEEVVVESDEADEAAVEKDWQAEEQKPQAQPANLEELRDEGKPVSTATPELDVILDIPVNISMEVGNTEITIRNLLQLNQGSVIELDRLAGEPLDVKVNGTLIAHGEVVVVNEKFGIRLTDVVSPSERVKKLR